MARRSEDHGEKGRFSRTLGLFSLLMFPSPGGAHPSAEVLFGGRYAVDGALPWGGLVSYYRASSEGTPLMLSVIPMEVTRSPAAEADFARLAHGLGSIRSHAVPRILDAGVIDGVPYLAFTDTRGTLLSDVLRDRHLSSHAVLRLAADVLDALRAAHAQGVVHGDLTPNNIVVVRGPDGRLGARVIGLGAIPLIRAHPEASAHPATTGSGKHAVAYMAPELFGGGLPQPSADVYSAGALIHHMVTGSPPVGWETGEGFEDVPELPDVIRRAMAKRPHERYPSAETMLAALEWIEVESAKHDPSTRRAGSSRPAGTILSTSGARPIPIEPIVVEEINPDTRRRWRQVFLLLLLLAALGFSGYWWRSQGQPETSSVPEGRVGTSAEHAQ